MEFRRHSLKTVLNNCCLGEIKCQSCIGKQCFIGFAKIIADYIAAKNTLIISNGFKMVPRQDCKVYEADKVAMALATINLECKNCMDNHHDDCPVNIIRSSLEVALLGRHLEFTGSSIAYMKDLTQINAELGNKVLQYYIRLKETANH